MGRTASIELAAVVAAMARLSAPAAYDDVTPEAYPDADSVLVEGVERVEYAPDGTYTADYDNTVKILTEKGRREERVFELTYNARYGTAEILGVSIVEDDGTERPVDVSATTSETTDGSSAAANIYDPMRRKIVCTIPGLEVGDALRCRYRRSVLKSRVQGVFASSAVLEWTCPMVRQTVTVVAPKDLPLARMEVRSPLGNVEYSATAMDDGSAVHVWTATNSPQAFAEPDMPPMHTQVQRVVFSTASDWREISRWYSDLCAPHLEKTTGAMSNRVAEIVAALPEGAGRTDAMRAIYKWVSQEVRYMGLTMEDDSPGYAPHDIDITFENRYGVCRDKAALLAAMLRIAGFDACPALINVGEKMDPDVPQPYFNHAITAVRAPDDPSADDSGFILMDSTNESSRDLLPAYLGGMSYLVATPEGEGLHVSRVVPADRNAVSVDTECTLDDEGVLVVRSRAAFTGLNDTIYRGSLLRKKADERRKLFERIVRNVLPGAELLSLEIEPADLRDTETPFSVSLLAKTGDFVLKGETRDEIPLPYLSRAIGSANWLLDDKTSLDHRRFALVLDSTAKTTERLRVKYGDALGAPAYVPDAASEAGLYSFSLECAASNGVLEARRELSVEAVEFSPGEYDALRESIKRFEAAERKRPSFARDLESGADVRVLRKTCDCTVVSPREWVVTNEVSKRVLTYRGKRNSAELKFRFNPSWKNVELLYATVSNMNGSVATAGERERSLFDCGWATSAPRYPATKELVVNLPAVEIGSVVSYATVTTVSNSPAPFRADWYFDSQEPADEMSVSYRDWTGEEWSRRETAPRRVADEPMQAAGVLWRDVKGVSHGDFAAAARSLGSAADVDAAGEEAVAEVLGGLGADEPDAKRFKAIRDWMAKNVRVSGPSLYELPLDMQLTPAETVLRERYASRLDYVRTMCALARGAGLDADVVFASSDAALDPTVAKRDMFDLPDVSEFSAALCRVRVEDGGFLFGGGKTREYFAGVESEYAPLGASSYAQSHYLDPATGGFGTVEPPADDLMPREETQIEIWVRANGAVDVDYERRLYGPEAGAFRKLYSEMLPEERSRHFQEVLGALSQSATATRELATDVEGYPATMRYSAYVPDYATVAGDAISINVPAVGFTPFPVGCAARKTPIGLSRQHGGTVVVKVVFPEGYDTVEHLPEGYSLADPTDGTELYSLSAEHGLDSDGSAVVTLTRERRAHGAKTLPRECAALLADYARMASSRSNRTIVVRRSGKAPSDR
jgi:transglutaminase-like putative cysteine protease